MRTVFRGGTGRLPTALLLSGILTVRPLAAAETPRIVNGTVSSSFVSIGALLIYDDAEQSQVVGLCSGTLVGCQTFVTAAHCVCPDEADDALTCHAFGLTDPGLLRVFLQHEGFVPVAAVTINPDYEFATGGDIAVLQLAEPVNDLVPSPINTVSKPATGTAGTIVGFGRTADRRFLASDAGIKREGKVTVADCDGIVPNETNVCWQFVGTDSTTCSGDSGGPLFIDLGDGPVLAGITSGGGSASCSAPDVSFDTNVFGYAGWIADQVADAADGCGTAVSTANRLTTILAEASELSTASADVRFEIDVPPQTTRLRVTLNGQLTFGSGFSMTTNDFDLYVRADSEPTTTTYDCADLNPSVFGACDIVSPAPGTWRVLVHRVQGGGTFQLTATIDSAPVSTCTGDCTGDHEVTIDDLVTGVGIALGDLNATACLALDTDSDGVVTIDELLSAVVNALDGCP